MTNSEYGSLGRYEWHPKSIFGVPVNHFWGSVYAIRDDAEGITLVYELPGADKENIKTEVADGKLTIKASRTFPSKDETERSFTLGNLLDPEKITATFHNGLLNIRVDRKDSVKPRLIEIK